MEIVGLSLKNILNYLPSLNISNSEKIIDICQRLANVDDPVSEEIMKVALFEYFPKLKDDIHLMIIQSSWKRITPVFFKIIHFSLRFYFPV